MNGVAVSAQAPLSQAFFARGNIGTAGGWLASYYLAEPQVLASPA